MEKGSGTDPTILNTLSKATVEFTENGRFSMVVSGIPVEGTAHLNSSGGTLAMELVMGQPVARAKESGFCKTDVLNVKWVNENTMHVDDPMGFQKSGIDFLRDKTR